MESKGRVIPFEMKELFEHHHEGATGGAIVAVLKLGGALHSAQHEERLAQEGKWSFA